MITGIYLAQFYDPTPERAHASVAYITGVRRRTVRSLHYWLSSAVVLTLVCTWCGRSPRRRSSRRARRSGSQACCCSCWPPGGEVIALDPAGPLSDAAWAKENLAGAKQTLPNGYCGLPLQQSCPHRNACLTCDRQRLVEMNEPVRLNLTRIIDGLQALDGQHDDER